MIFVWCFVQYTSTRYVEYQWPAADAVDVGVAQLTAHWVDQNGPKRETAETECQQGRRFLVRRPRAEQLKTRANNQALQNVRVFCRHRQQYAIRKQSQFSNYETHTICYVKY